MLTSLLQSDDGDSGLSRGSVLAAQGFRFLKISTLAGLVALLAYIWHAPPGGPAGDTWLGYTLGVSTAALVAWLSYFGIRKRRYAASSIDLRNWLSAHIYLGLLTVLLATLHSGFSFSFSLHGLTFTLLVLTVASGLFGVQAYTRYPRLITANRNGMSFDALLGQIAETDAELQAAAFQLGDDLNRAIHDAIQGTVVSGSLAQRLSGRMPNCPTARLRQQIEATVKGGGSAQAIELRRILGLLTRKEILLGRARRELQMLGWLQAWLFVHVPVSVALLAAIAAHVFTVFFHW